MPTTVTLRPNSIVSTSGLTALAGGTSLADDLTTTGYRQTATGTAASIRMAFTTATLPVNGVIKSITPRFSCQSTIYTVPGGMGGGGFITQTGSVQLFSSSYIGDGTSRSRSIAQTNSPNFGAYAGQLPYQGSAVLLPPAGLGYDPTLQDAYQFSTAYGTQAAIDNIEAVFNIGAVSTNYTVTQNWSLFDAYLDVVYNTLPTVTSPAVVGASVTNRPTISAVFSSAETTAKGKYAVVKIFTAAEVAAAFFDPKTQNPPAARAKTFTLGNIAPGTSFSYTPTSDLANGSYTAFIWVMDDLSEGTWSYYTQSVAFTVAVPQLEACTVAVTAEPNDTYGPRQKITLTQSGNLLPQYASGFEAMLFSPGTNLLTGNQQGVETDTTGFTARVGTTIARTTTAGQFLTGVAGLAITFTTTGPTPASIALGASPTIPVTPATVYTWTSWLKPISGVSSMTVNLALEWYDSAGSLISTSTSGTWNLVSTQTGFKQLMVQAIAPSALIEGRDAAYVIPVFNATTGSWTASSVVAMDNNDLYANEGLCFTPYTSNATPTTLSVVSTSGFSDTVGASALRFVSPAVSATYEVGVGSVNAPDQAGSIHVPGSTTALSALTPVTAAATYTAGAKLGHSSASRTARVGIRWYTNLGALISTTWSTATATSTTLYGSYTVTGAAPASSAWAVVIVEFQASISDTHYIESVFLRAGSSTTWSVGGWAPLQTTASLRNRIWFQIQRTDNGNDATQTWKTIGYLQAAPAIAGGQPTVFHYGADAAAGTLGSYSITNGTLTVNAWDYSAPVNQGAGVVRYRARTVIGAYTDIAAGRESLLTASAWTADTNASSLTGTKFYLTDVITPSNSIILSIDSELSSTSEEQQTAYRPLGRSRHVVLSDGFTGEQFDSIDLHFKTEAEYNKFETLRKLGRTILLQTDMYTQWWVRLGGARQVTLPYKANRVTAPYRHVTIPAIEVDPVNEA